MKPPMLKTRALPHKLTLRLVEPEPVRRFIHDISSLATSKRIRFGLRALKEDTPPKVPDDHTGPLHADCLPERVCKVDVRGCYRPEPGSHHAIQISKRHARQYVRSG